MKNSDPNKSPIPFHLLAIALVALMLLAGVLYLGKEYFVGEQIAISSGSNTNSKAIEGIAGLKLGGDFELIRHDGEVVTDKTYAGKPRLMFFGFTYCPDICPTELAMITRILNDIPEEKADQLNVLYISVDPERDTPDHLKEYLTLFHPNIHGLTGSQEQIDHIKKLYRVYSSKVYPEDSTDYTVDHSAFLYLFDKKDNLVAMFRNGASEEEVKAAILQQL